MHISSWRADSCCPSCLPVSAYSRERHDMASLRFNTKMSSSIKFTKSLSRDNSQRIPRNHLKFSCNVRSRRRSAEKKNHSKYSFARHGFSQATERPLSLLLYALFRFPLSTSLHFHSADHPHLPPHSIFSSLSLLPALALSGGAPS